MLGFLQCIVITSYGGNYANTIKATAMEMPSQPLPNESTSTSDVDKSSDRVEENTLPAKLTSTELNNADIRVSVIEKQTMTKDPHSVAISMLHEDIKTMKGYIGKDSMKECAFTLHDQPDAQSSKQFYLDSIETLFRECSKAGGS